MESLSYQLIYKKVKANRSTPKAFPHHGESVPGQTGALSKGENTEGENLK